ncbi:MAG: FecR family protein [Pseudomonadota bacterium]
MSKAGEAHPEEMDARHSGAHASEEEAALWVARLQSADHTVEEEQEFARWLEQHPLNGKLFNELNDLWGNLRDVPIPKDRLNRLQRSQKITKAAVGLCVAGLAVSIGLFQAGYIDRWRSDHYSVVGEVRVVELEDGTKMFLNTDTAVQIAYSDAARKINILRGESYFDVVSDPNRPFIVSDGSLEATAVGTRYSVGNLGSATEVFIQVEEGGVSVRNGEEEVLVGADQFAVSKENTLEVLNGDVSGRLAWREGQLVFSDTPLSQVLATLDQYRSGKIVVVGDSIAELKVSGVFDLNDTGQALEALSASLPVQVNYLTDKLVFVRAK